MANNAKCPTGANALQGSLKLNPAASLSQLTVITGVSCFNSDKCLNEGPSAVSKCLKTQGSRGYLTTKTVEMRAFGEPLCPQPSPRNQRTLDLPWTHGQAWTRLCPWLTSRKSRTFNVLWTELLSRRRVKKFFLNGRKWILFRLEKKKKKKIISVREKISREKKRPRKAVHERLKAQRLRGFSRGQGSVHGCPWCPQLPKSLVIPATSVLSTDLQKHLHFDTLRCVLPSTLVFSST